ncbi:MAG: dipeptidase [Thermoanaerobaculia bacterium]
MITRRTFLGAAAALAGTRLAWGGEPALPLAIDTLTPDGPGFDPRAAVAAGLSAAVVDIRCFPRNFANATQARAEWTSAFEREGSGFLAVLKAADVEEARRLGKLGIILACQDAAILDASTYSVNDRNLDNLRFFHTLGLRVLQLTHNDRNAVGDSYRERSDAGLSLLGERLVAEMNGLGMLIDLSHCGDRTTLEAIRLSKRPAAVTHAGCRALFPTGRNKTDEVIRALAEKGGYFGIFSMSVWLTDRDKPSVDDVVDHLDHVVKVGGIGLAGFGSDGPVLADDTPPEIVLQGHRGFYRRNQGLPGSEREPKHVTVPDLNTPKRMQVLADALKRRGWKADAVEKVLGGNFLRLLREVCG